MAEEMEVAAAPGKSRIDLPRALGLWDIICIVIGGVIGSGIFLTPKDIAADVEAPLLIFAVWIVGGILSFFGALAFAEMGAALPEAGGMYVYLREAYGPLLSFLFGWTLFLVIDSGAVATLAVAFASNYLPQFFEMTPLVQKAVAVALIVFLASVNYIGVRWGANLQNLLTIIKTAALVAVSGILLIFAKGGSTANFTAPAPQAFSTGLMGSFGLALVAVLWSYKGWEAATYSAGETRRPERNLPLGLFIGTLIVIALYIIANLAYLYVLPSSAIARSDRIASDAMNQVVGPVGASLVAFIILFSIMGAANQNMLCSPRVYFAMARDGLFFKRIADAHPKYLTPHFSIIAISAWSIVLTLFFGTFKQLFTYVVFGQWLFFGLTVAAVFVLRKKRPDLHRPYKTWGYPVTPLIFILGALFISVNTLVREFRNALAGLAIIGLGIPVYFYWKRKLGKETAS
ncbi:MAG: amino acid permease [Acidobacteriota bacterium]|nr:amino acid permease [Acidobacteriota bacterium]